MHLDPVLRVRRDGMLVNRALAIALQLDQVVDEPYRHVKSGIIGGCRTFSVDEALLDSIPPAFVAGRDGHESSLATIRQDIERIKRRRADK